MDADVKKAGENITLGSIKFHSAFFPNESGASSLSTF
jgi:hypothetical protein